MKCQSTADEKYSDALSSSKVSILNIMIIIANITIITLYRVQMMMKMASIMMILFFLLSTSSRLQKGYNSHYIMNDTLELIMHKKIMKNSNDSCIYR